jgi:hypothetical protein
MYACRRAIRIHTLLARRRSCRYSTGKHSAGSRGEPQFIYVFHFSFNNTPYSIITIQAMYVYHNIETRSKNHFCRGKAINITYFCVRVCVCGWVSACVCVDVGTRARTSACACVALIIQHATRRHIVCGLSGSTIIFDITS